MLRPHPNTPATDRIDDAMDQLLGLFERGGPTMYVIAAVAVVGLSLFVERLLAVHGLVPHVRGLNRRVRDAAAVAAVPSLLSHCTEAGHNLAPVLGRGVELAMRGADRDDIFRAMAREARRLYLGIRRGLGLLATLGTMAPFLGLLGTVLGIMQALRDIGKHGSGGYDVVSVGVAEALITTAAGIVVAVVIVLLHQYLRARLRAVVLEVQLLIEEVADHVSRLGVGPTAAAEAEVKTEAGRDG